MGGNEHALAPSKAPLCSVSVLYTKGDLLHPMFSVDYRIILPIIVGPVDKLSASGRKPGWLTRGNRGREIVSTVHEDAAKGAGWDAVVGIGADFPERYFAHFVHKQKLENLNLADVLLCLRVIANFLPMRDMYHSDFKEKRLNKSTWRPLHSLECVAPKSQTVSQYDHCLVATGKRQTCLRFSSCIPDITLGPISRLKEPAQSFSY
jgi:hypothetical protein